MGCFGRCIKSKVTKGCLKLCFSHVGLCIIVLGYMALGAIIFRGIELDGETMRTEFVRVVYNDVETARNSSLFLIDAYVDNHDQDDMTNNDSAVNMIGGYLDLYKNSIIYAYQNTTGADYWAGYQPGYEGQTPPDDSKWSYASAILFSATILTTIGYGHVYPVTQMGYLVFLLYSVFAIPLMSIYLMDISLMLANCIRLIYHKIFGYMCSKSKQKSVQSETTLEDTSKNASNAFTIQNLENRVAATDYWNEMQDISSKKGNVAKYGNVPVLFTLMIVVVYIILSTGIFYWSEGWSLIESAYYTITTLLTIGFGDYVPGKKGMNTTVGQLILAAYSMYTLIGMAILAMGIQLIMSTVLDRFKLGLNSQ